MGCGSCGNSNGQHSAGCGQNGDCSTGSCNKLNVYNWLADMVLPEDYAPFNIVEVRFKGSKKLFFIKYFSKCLIKELTLDFEAILVFVLFLSNKFSLKILNIS